MSCPSEFLSSSLEVDVCQVADEEAMSSKSDVVESWSSTIRIVGSRRRGGGLVRKNT